MIVQQPVVILVLSQEGVRARPSTPPSWLISHYTFLLVELKFLVGTELKFFNVLKSRKWLMISSHFKLSLAPLLDPGN